MKLPNGPKSPPLVQMLQWVADPIGYMKAANQRYGDIFTAQIGWDVNPNVLVSNPQAIQQIFTSESKQFSPFDKSLDNFVKPYFGENSIVRLEGERHRSQRQMLMPSFHGERMRAYGAQICSITEGVMSRLSQSKPFKARDVMRDISLELTFKIIFGLQNGEREERIKQLLVAWIDTLSSHTGTILLLLPFLQKDLGAWSPWGRFQNLKKELSELLYAEIRERRQQYDLSRTDILTLLLSVKDEAGVGMSDEEVYDDLITLLNAGHDTTASVMSWLMYWVHRQPEVRKKLLEELDTLGDSPDPMDISRLPYLNAVCSENLRISPVLSLNFPHVVREPVDLMGYQLEPGTKVICNIYLTHHRPDLYPEPDQFKPERFLERQFSPFEYLPFGGGNRRCIGAALALFEMKLVLATILSRYQLALSESRPARPQLRFGVTLVPAGGVKMVFEGERRRQERPLPDLQLAK